MKSSILNIFQKKWLILFIVFGGSICGTTLGAFFALTHDLPQIRQLESFQPSAVTRIYSSDHVLLAELFSEKRDPVPLEQMPDYLKAGLLATEDRNFYLHSGVDIRGIVRALVKDIMAGEFVEGASTLTQQLAKTLFLTPRKTLMRKVQEALLAVQLERRYTKDEILELYLNQVYLGSGAYGVESASKLFFAKSVQDLTLAECALIAGMPKAPSRYSPLANKDLATQRRNVVLKQMAQTGIISQAQYEQAVQEPVDPPSKPNISIRAPYFVQYIKKELESSLGEFLVYHGGLRVLTTLSYSMQKHAEQAVAEGLAALETRMLQNGIVDPHPQCALAALDVQSGGILAMVGGRDYRESAYNRAVMARRQPGSAFKPIVYACAIERGFSQNQLLLDAPVVFKGGRNGKDWQPENFSGQFKGEMTFRKALVLSENVPAIRLIEMLGPSSVSDFGHRLGIDSPLSSNLSLALGTSELSLLELTAAYSVFPNQGNLIKPFGIIGVIDPQDRDIWQKRRHQSPAMSRTGAAIITDMLQGVIQEGTGRRARELAQAVGGKTGTTNDCKDALFLGFSPSCAAGVWVGNDDHSSLGKLETGARAALPIWTAFMEKVPPDNGIHPYFDIPDDVVKQWMDPASGHVSSEPQAGYVPALFHKDRLISYE